MGNEKGIKTCHYKKKKKKRKGGKWQSKGEDVGELQDIQKAINKIAVVSPSMSVITLNVNV